MSQLHYLNLTNGIEAMPSLAGQPFRFIRIQFTACEQKRWDFILQDLDCDFLISLARGHECIVHDAGHNGNPRALWQGLEFVRYALSLRWFGVAPAPIVRKHNVREYFECQYRKLSSRTLVKLGYFRRWLNCKAIKLTAAPSFTARAGDYEWYVEALRAEERRTGTCESD